MLASNNKPVSSMNGYYNESIQQIRSATLPDFHIHNNLNINQTPYKPKGKNEIKRYRFCSEVTVVSLLQRANNNRALRPV
jgi:hypothetical protein